MANSKVTARTEIEKLVRYFEANIHQLKAPSFNEAQARQQLIDPFFEALGRLEKQMRRAASHQSQPRRVLNATANSPDSWSLHLEHKSQALGFLDRDAALLDLPLHQFGKNPRASLA